MAELNGFVEDPTLWNDPERAQKIMRERTDLESRINGYLKLERDLKDSIELIELGEMEEDATVVTDAENTLRGLKDEIARQRRELPWVCTAVRKPSSGAPAFVPARAA